MAKKYQAHSFPKNQQLHFKECTSLDLELNIRYDSRAVVRQVRMTCWTAES